MQKKIIILILLLLSFDLLISAPRQKPKLKIFEKDNLFGYQDKNGNTVIKPIFQLAMDFNKKGVAFVATKDGWFCIDSKGKQLLKPFIFDNGPDYFEDGFARFEENGKIGFFDEACQKVIPADFDFAYPFQSGFAKVCNGCKTTKVGEHSMISGGKYGKINRKGQLVNSIE